MALSISSRAYSRGCWWIGDRLSGLLGFVAVQRVVAISAFTTLREKAAEILAGPLSHLLIESYDNRAGVGEFDNGIWKRKSRIFTGRTTR
jgi:hypothetical protein